jgi:hypothetical protein
MRANVRNKLQQTSQEADGSMLDGGVQLLVDFGLMILISGTRISHVSEPFNDYLGRHLRFGLRRFGSSV